MRIDHFVAVIHIICIRFSRNYFYIPYTIPLFALCFSLLVNAILNIIYDSQLRKASEKINHKPIDKFIFSKKRNNFQTKTWEELEVGDIIKVYKDQELPADVLILDITGQTNEQICHVMGGLMTDV